MKCINLLSLLVVAIVYSLGAKKEHDVRFNPEEGDLPVDEKVWNKG